MEQNKKKKLWIISELFPPEETSTSYIMGKIANAMCEKYDVSVICGPEVYDKKKKTNPSEILSIDSSIQINRVDYEIKDGGKFARIYSFLYRSWKLFCVIKKNVKKDDKVLMVSNPFPLIILMGYLRRYRNFEFSMLVHDVFPESLYTEIKIPPKLYTIASYYFNNAYSSTDQLISIGRDMNEVLEKKCSRFKYKPQIKLIENWGDVIGIKPLDLKEDSDKIIIQYAGNIGYSQGVDKIINVIKDVQNRNVLLSIWGTGAAEKYLKEIVALNNLENFISFNGPYYRSQQCKILNECDIALVSLAEGMYGLGVPSKSYNILAAGKPILYIGERNSEIWLLVEENNIGFCFEPTDSDNIISFISSLSEKDKSVLLEMGRNSRLIAEKFFSESVILNKFKETI